MKAVDLFSGCGGLSLGLKKAGIIIEAAYENWEPAISIYKKNFKHPAYNFDLSDVQRVTDHISNFHPEIDMIVGGPPCQDFSSAGTRNEEGSRANLTMAYANIIKEIKPRWFLMENVDRIVKTEIFHRVKETLSSSDYGLTEAVLDASFCNVPQRRKRMFLIGLLNEGDNFLSDSLTGGLSKKSMTIRRYMGKAIDTEFYYRHPRSYSRRAIFSIDEPSPTIRGVNRPIPPNYQFHPGDATADLTKVRPLSTAERARIQTFPNSFKWADTPKSILEQIIGNAVPVNLANYVGSCIIEHEAILKKQQGEFTEEHLVENVA